MILSDFMKNTGTHFWERKKPSDKDVVVYTLNKDLTIVKSSNGAKLNCFLFQMTLSLAVFGL